MSRLFFGVLGVCVTTASLGACAQVWGFDEGSLAGDSTDGGAADANPSGDGATPPADGSTPPGDGATDDDGGSVLVPENCETRTIDELGYFVTEGGADGTDCGAPNNPCATLQGALVAFRSGTTLKPHFHIATGTPHRESVVIPEAVMAAGATLEGAWFARKNGQNWQWATDCSRATVIASPGTRGVTVERAADDDSEPRTLTITNLQIGFAEDVEHAAGTSFYGVFASHASLALKNVRIVVPAGRDGTAGSAGAEGERGATTPPLGGGSNPGSGADGAAGNHAAPQVGSFGPQGYATAPAPQPGASRGEDGQNSPTTCGTHSTAGRGGELGRPGLAGGTAVGVYAWSSSLALASVHVQTGRGGAGGDGGRGGGGGKGGAVENLGSCNRKAGNGGNGGNGSAAPGGASVCIVRAGGGSLDGADAQLQCTHGEGGAAGVSPDQPAFSAEPGAAQAVLEPAP